MGGYPPFFVSADSTRVTGAILGSVDFKGVVDGQFRPKQGKTRSLSASVDSEEFREGRRVTVDFIGTRERVSDEGGIIRLSPMNHK
jgi:hypothetical protein